MNTKHYLSILAVLALLLVVSCDDNTDTLGVDIMPGTDFMTKEYKTYDVTTASHPVETLYWHVQVCHI